MTYELRCGFDVMSELQDSLTTAYRRIEAVLDRFDGEMGQLLSTWTGSAADAFAASINEWQGKMYTLRGRLGSAESLVGQAIEAFTRNERALVKVWS